MVIKLDSDPRLKSSSSYLFNFNQTLCSLSEQQMDNTNTHFENITSPGGIMTNRQHSPNGEDSNKSNSYYSASPSDNFQRSNSQSSLSGTMSPQEYTDLRSPLRQDSAFFPQHNTTMFDPTAVPNSGVTSYPAQSFGIFGGGNGNLQHLGNSGVHMMNNSGLDMNSKLEIKANMQQSPHAFYAHESSQPPFHGNQLPSPNSHRSNMASLGLPSISPFPGYRPYPQINEVFPSKQEFYMQSPFYPAGYPNYW